MKGNLKRMCAAVAAAAGLTLACTVPAAAYSDSAAQQEQAVEAEEELWPLEEQEPEETGSTPFSMPGNGELVDDVEDGGTSKQFLTVQTKNGNTFYIVVDRSGNTENVYMLSLVDENDLAEFIEIADSGGDAAALEIPEPALDLETSADEEEAGDGQEDDADGEKQEEGTGKGGSILVILILGVCAAGICYCLKTARAQKKSDSIEEESLEFYNDYEENQGDSSENEE